MPGQVTSRVRALRAQATGADGSVRVNAHGGRQSAASRLLRSAGILGRPDRTPRGRGRRVSPPLWWQDANGEWWISLDVLYRDMWIVAQDIDGRKRGRC